MNNLSEKLKWFEKHLLSDILPIWLKHSQTKNGLFFVHFRRKWERENRDTCTLVSQTRLLYNFSVGYRLTGQNMYLEVVNRGADALLRYFRDSKNGGWFWACNLDGEAVVLHKDLYGHAFAIFGLIHAASVTSREELKQAAWDTYDIVFSHFRDRYGGFVRELNRSFEKSNQTKSQNPIMHLFEALLAMNTIDSSPDVRQHVKEVADFVLNRLIRKSDGILPELFYSDWRELSREDGGRIDIGHAFEWAYLLSHAVECGFSRNYLKQAFLFLEYGLEFGLDKTEGGILSPMMPDGTLSSVRKGWWEQCEAIRTLLHFGIVREHPEVWNPLESTVEFVKSNFIDEEYGGWFMYPVTESDGKDGSLNKGSEWKVDYHVVGMCAEAIRKEADLAKKS